MSALRQSLDDYLAVRRSVGYKLESVARMLSSFVAFAERAGAGTITTELALSWATQPQQASPIWLAHRLSAVRGFAPYLYSDADIAALLAAARRLTPPLQAATFETLLGLLAVTGLRIGEAMRLDRDDIDWDEKALVVRSSKFGRSREVVCHDSTIEALRTYSARRDQLCPRPASASFFVSQRGRRLAHHSVYAAFHQLAGEAGLPQRPGVRRRSGFLWRGRGSGAGDADAGVAGGRLTGFWLAAAPCRRGGALRGCIRGRVPARWGASDAARPSPLSFWRSPRGGPLG